MPCLADPSIPSLAKSPTLVTRLDQRAACKQIVLAVVAWALALVTTPAWATNYTWVGGGATNNWGDITNWIGSIPPTSQSSGTTTNVFLRGSGGSSDLADILNNDADWKVDSLTFESLATGSWSLIGGKLVIGNTFCCSSHFIRNSDGNTHSFNNSRVDLSESSITFDADVGDLDFNTNVFFLLNNSTLTATGGNDVFFDGGIGGESFVNNATLSISGGTTVHIGGTSTILSQVTLSNGTLQIDSNSNLGDAVNITTFAGTTFNVNGFTENIDQITGSGNIALGSGSLTLGDSSDFTFSGSISGSGNIFKNQSGTLTLAGTSTYSGTTNVQAGTLRLNNSTTDGSLSSTTDVIVSTGATFDLNGVIDTVDSISGSGTILLGGGELTVDESSGTRTYSGNISESGTLRKNGNHTLTLSGNNSFTNLIIGAGELSVSSSNNLGDATASIVVGGTLGINGTFTNARTILLSDGTIDVAAGSTLTQSGMVANNTSGASLTKTNQGTLILSGSNTYSGDTIVSGGVLRIAGSERISNISDLVVNTNGQFDLNSFPETVGGLSGSGGTINTSTATGRLTVDQSENSSYAGQIIGPGGFTKRGVGTLTLSTSQAFSGSTLIEGGTLQLTGTGSLTSLTDVVISTGATLDLNGISDTVDSIAGNGSILLGGAGLSVDQTFGTNTFSGTISESGSISKSGGHTLILSGNNSFTGGVAVFDGILSVGADSNLGAATGSITLAANGTLATTGSFTTARDLQFGMAANGTIDTAAGTTLTHTGAISGSSDVTFRKSGGGTYTMAAGSPGFSGNIVVDGGTFEIGNFSGDALGNSTRITVNASGTLLNNQVEGFGSLAGSGNVITNNTLEVGFDNTSTTFSGTIGGDVGAGFFGKAGTGVMTITQPLTYLGDTRVNDGILRLSGNGGLPDTSDVQVNATWDLNNVSDAIDSLTGTGSVLLGNGTLTVGSNNGSGSFLGVISEAGSPSQEALVKVGTGTLILGGNNTYTFGTEILGGTLQITHSDNLGLGSLRIGNGARLHVSGTTTNARTIDLASGGGVIGVSSLETLTQSAAITGIFGGLTKEGPGTLLLTAASTYAGETMITSGILRHQSSGRLSDITDVTISPGATWDLNGVSDTVDSFAGSGSILLGGGTLTVQENGGTRTFSGVMAEPGGLVKRGSHVLELTGNNTFSGPITVEGGKLSVAADTRLGAVSNNLTLNGGTLLATSPFTTQRDIDLGTNGGTVEVSGSFLSMGGNVTGSGQLRKTGPGSLSLANGNTYAGGTLVSGGTVEIVANSGLGLNSGDVTLATGALLATADLTNLHRVVLQGGGTIDVDGATLTQTAALTGTGNLTKAGDGVLRLTVPATHSGDTIIQGGTLEFGSGSLPDLFDVSVASTATWDLNRVRDTIDGLFGNGTIVLRSGELTLGAADGNGDFSGRLIGPGSLVKIGRGEQTLAGTSYSQTSTTINSGAIRLNSNSPLGAAGANLNFGGGALHSTATFTIPRNVNLNSAGGTFDVDAATTLTIANPVTGVGGLTKTGLGTLVLQANNNFGGPTRVLEGWLQLDAGMTFGGLSGNGNIELGLNELIVNSTANDVYGGIISGVGGKLTKDGPGTLTLTGINTYTGGTCILDGVLRISQSENLGALGTLITFDGGTLNTTASFNMIRGIALNAGNGTFDVDAGTQLGASGNITGVGSLTKIGDGTLSLVGGFSSFEGGTNILAGEIEINNNINLGNTVGQLTLDNGSLHTSANVSMARLTTLGPGGGAFQTDAATLLTHSGAMVGNPGAAGVTKRGAGDLRWQGNNSFTGNIILEGGRLQVDASGQLGDAANLLRMRGGGLHALATMTNGRAIHLEDGVGTNTIEVNNAATLTQSGVISDGSGGVPLALTKAGLGELLISASNTYSSPTFIEQGTLRLAGGGQLPDVTDVTIATDAAFDLNNINDAIDALAGRGDVLLGTAALTVGADNGDGFFDGVISGPGSLVKTGTGKQTLSTRLGGMGQPVPNTYAGGTQVNGGILNIELDGNLGASTGPLGLDNGELEVERRGPGGSLNTNRVVTLGPGGGTIDTMGMNVSATFNDVIGGPGSLTKQGLGSMTVTAANTYGGDTIIDGGLIQLQGAGRLPDTSRVEVNVASNMTVPQGFSLNNISDAINGLDGNGEVNLGSGTLTVGAADGNGSFSGTILGTGGVVKAGTGTQVLSGNNTYSGGTRIVAGALQVPLNNSLGNTAGGLTFDGGTLRTTGSFATARTTILLGGHGTIDTASGTTLTHQGIISGVGGVTKSGDGTLIVAASNTYTGPTIVSGGTLQLANVERLANETDVTVSPTATFDLNNFNETIDALSGTGSVTLGSASLVVGINNGTSNFGGVISGTGDMLKEGAGVQTLSGQNTYSGATFVDGGELVLNDGGRIDQSTTIVGFNIGSNGTATAEGAGTTWDLSGNLVVGLDGMARMNIRSGAVMTVEGDVRVGSNNQGAASRGTLSLDGGTLDNSAGNGVDVINGTLQGHGTILGDVDNLSRLAPGNSAGILEITGNVVQSSLATLAIEVGGRDNSNPLAPQFDVLDVTGNLAFDGALEVSLLGGFTPLPSDTFTVADASLLVGAFTNVANGSRLNLTSGGTGSFQVNYGPGSPFGPNQLVLSDFQGTGSLLGDFDGNGLYECADVDSLVAVIAAGSNLLIFDMNSDGQVNSADLTQWLAVAGAANLPSGGSYLLADANLDGSVDGSDFGVWNANKFTATAAWCSGDFNADGTVDGSDFGVWNGNKFTSAAASSFVPEPSGWLVGLLVMAATAARRRR